MTHYCGCHGYIVIVIQGLYVITCLEYNWPQSNKYYHDCMIKSHPSRSSIVTNCLEYFPLAVPMFLSSIFHTTLLL